MCGIAGIFHPRQDVEAMEVEAFTRSLRHRGPDGEGFYVDKEIALGHRHLTITDPRGCHQPLADLEKRYWITFNGEIFNFREIKNILQSHGHRFRTETDTEVVLASYAQWGPGCQMKFNGMWAFAIWDSLTKSLFLSRDRFGIKPLYYSQAQGRFTFASELKAFLALDGPKPAWSVQFLTDLLGTSSSSDVGEETFLSSVRSLPAGHCLWVSPEGIKKTRWWRTCEHLSDPPTSFSEQAHTLLELLRDACQLRTPQHVRFGTSLSGGLDSSAIAGMMGELFPTDQRAGFSREALHAYFPDFTDGETNYARMAAASANLRLRLKAVTPSDVLAHLDDVIFANESVKGIPSVRWLTYREMRAAGTVVTLDGDGSDEIFAGYAHHPSFALSLFPGPRWSALHRAHLALHPRRRSRLSEFVVEAGRKKIVRRLGIWNAEMDRQLDGVPWAHRSWRALSRKVRPARPILHWLRREPRALASPVMKADHVILRRSDPLTRQLYYEFHDGVLPGILRAVDRCSMAHGVEVRSPFLDWRVVCFALSLPSTSKLGNGGGKRVLREAMAQHVPQPILNRREKMPFTSPRNFWLAGPLREFLLDQISSRDFLESDLWEGARVRTDVAKALKEGNLGVASAAWPLVQTLRLKQLFANQP